MTDSSERAPDVDGWWPPTVYRFDHDRDLKRLVCDAKIARVLDPIEHIADDLFELRHPDRIDEYAARSKVHAEMLGQGVSFGSWVHFPWSRTIVRFPEDDDHYALRTFRNRNLVTEAEQRALRATKIAVFGLSVGSNVVDTIVQSGVGNNYLLFDFDRLSPTNLNRVRADMADVGLMKTTVAGRKIAELDPYVAQRHFPSGYDDSTDDVLREERPNLIIEEVDDMEVKARLRRIARELHIPLVMAGDVADRSILHIERYDLDGDKLAPFNGKLSPTQVDALVSGRMSAKDQEGCLIKLLGLRNLSPRLLSSAMARGVELVGLPQLGSTATIGGGLAAVAIRDILLGRRVGSGSRGIDARKTVGSSSPTGAIEGLKTVAQFAAYRRRAVSASSEE